MGHRDDLRIKRMLHKLRDYVKKKPRHGPKPESVAICICEGIDRAERWYEAHIRYKTRVVKVEAATLEALDEKRIDVYMKSEQQE